MLKAFSKGLFYGFVILVTEPAFARKTSQPILQDPFDTAAGGASLTRAARQSVILANPALMPYGAKFHRWIGTQFGVLANKDSIEFLQSMVNGGSNDAEGEEEAGDTATALIDKVFDTPIHAGFFNITSYIINNFGLALFGSSVIDIQAREFGDTGMPEVRFGMDLYVGGAGGFAVQTFKWLSLGLTAKYLMVAEPSIGVSLVDQEQIASLSDPSALQELASYGRGMGYDAGALVFLQGSAVDFRFALKVEDVGNTSFTGTQAPFLQTINAGTSLTLHSNKDALHLAVDFRDMQAAYDEHWFKRVYAGARLVMRQYIGLAYGLYQGWPSYGVRLDLLVMKLGATVHTKELGSYPGENPRSIYQVYLMSGF